MMLLSCSGAALNRLNQVLSWTTIKTCWPVVLLVKGSVKRKEKHQPPVHHFVPNRITLQTVMTFDSIKYQLWLINASIMLCTRWVVRRNGASKPDMSWISKPWKWPCRGYPRHCGHCDLFYVVILRSPVLKQWPQPLGIHDMRACQAFQF
jgi:hypothetical protein